MVCTGKLGQIIRSIEGPAEGSGLSPEGVKQAPQVFKQEPHSRISADSGGSLLRTVAEDDSCKDDKDSEKATVEVWRGWNRFKHLV